MKRVVSAAAVAAGLSISAVTLNAGSAFAAPLDPPPPCPNCHGGGGGGGNPGGGGGGGNPGGAGGQQNGPGGAQGGQTNPPQGGQTNPPQGGQTNPPQGGQNSPAPNEHGQYPQQGGQNDQTPNDHGQNPPGGQTNAPASEHNPPPQGRQALNPPSTQPPHQPYVPRGTYVSGNAEIGGPGDARAGFSVVDHGAPPPPPPRGHGWNDGPAPGHPPPHWVGAPPPGGWDGPPPPGGWNRPWSGPQRDVAVAQADFGPFQYDAYTAIPVFNWQFGGWGFWYMGVWVPLY
ncbi:MAG: MAP_0585 family protein [Mycobacterium sp.]